MKLSEYITKLQLIERSWGELVVKLADWNELWCEPNEKVAELFTVEISEYNGNSLIIGQLPEGFE